MENVAIITGYPARYILRKQKQTPKMGGVRVFQLGLAKGSQNAKKEEKFLNKKKNKKQKKEAMNVTPRFAPYKGAVFTILCSGI